MGFWHSITVGFYSFVFRILLLVFRQCGQYISFRRSFDWQWSHGGGLAVHKTGKEQLLLIFVYVHSQFFLNPLLANRIYNWITQQQLLYLSSFCIFENRNGNWIMQQHNKYTPFVEMLNNDVNHIHRTYSKINGHQP